MLPRRAAGSNGSMSVSSESEYELWVMMMWAKLWAYDEFTVETFCRRKERGNRAVSVGGLEGYGVHIVVEMDRSQRWYNAILPLPTFNQKGCIVFAQAKGGANKTPDGPR